jgi:1-pyrroline-5-carboxylate dehydrogenase
MLSRPTDAACELLTLPVQRISCRKSTSSSLSLPGMWNRLEHRPLEGFVFALTLFNFHVHRRQPVLLSRDDGNGGVEARHTQIYSAQVLMELFMKPACPTA